MRTAGLGHGYWAVLTIFIVLRPDYSSTLQRGLQRAAGTAIGAGLGVCTVLLGRLGPSALLAGIGVSLLAAYAVFTVNYLLYAVFLTDFVVVLLDLLGLPPESTAIYRLIGTCLGTGLAMLAYLFWPTWEGRSAAEKFARLNATQGAYAAALLRAYTRPADAARLRSLQLAARRARNDAAASADRLAGEPEHRADALGHGAGAGNGWPPDRAGVPDPRRRGGRPPRRPAARSGPAAPDHPQADLDAARRRGAKTRPRRSPRRCDALGAAEPRASALLLQLPPLRAQQQRIWHELGEPDEEQLAVRPDEQDSGRHDGDPDQAGEPRPVQDNEEAGLFAATDGLVDAINTAAFILRE